MRLIARGCVCWLAPLLFAGSASAGPPLLPVEGSARVALDVPVELAAGLPQVFFFVDGNSNGVYDSGPEALIAARGVSVRVDGVGQHRLFFTPPAYAATVWPVLTTPQSVAVWVQAAGGDQVFPNAFAYSADLPAGLDALKRGFLLYCDEALTYEGAARLAQVGPRAGAITETALRNLLRRAPAGLETATRNTLRDRLEAWLPDMRAALNASSALDALRAGIRTPVWGQTIHGPFRHVDEIVLLTLGPGTLVLTPDPAAVGLTPTTGGRLILPQDPASIGFGPSFAQGWDFALERTASAGSQLADVAARNPYVNVLEPVSPRLGMLNVRAAANGDELAFELREEHLSHTWVLPGVAYQPYAGEPPIPEFVLAAVYRIPLFGAPDPGNQERRALVVRQVFGLTGDFHAFEPTHCLTSMHAFPRASITMSQPEGEPPTSVEELRGDFRLGFDPADFSSTPSTGGWVAAYLKDKNAPELWLTIPTLATFCAPVPVWANIFDCTGTMAPIEYEQRITSAFTDNFHLHHVHTDSQPPWGAAPFVEAPGGFHGNIHLHWRWGTAYGPEFGSGAPLMPLNQSWELATVLSGFPASIGTDDWRDVLEQRRIESGGAGYAVVTAQKTLLVACRQTSVVNNRQYEMLSTGFSYGVGTPPLIDPLGATCAAVAGVNTALGGYYANTIGFCTSGANIALQALRFNPSLVSLISAACSVFTSLPPPPPTTVFLPVSFAHVALRAAPGTIEYEPGRFVTFMTSPTPDAMYVYSNFSARSRGYLLAAPMGATGVALDAVFSPPIRTLAQIGLLVRDEAGPQTLTIEAYAGAALVRRIVANAAVTPPGQYCETVVGLQSDALFDRITIRCDDPTLEFGVSGFTVSDSPVGPCDYDCDGLVNFNDIDPFVFALIDPSVYYEYFPQCDVRVHDPDGDGRPTFADIDCFIFCLINGGAIAPCH